MIPPSEEIVCREIITNNDDSPIINSDPLFELFSTELFDPSSESMEEMEKYLDVVANQDVENEEPDKGATLLK